MLVSRLLRQTVTAFIVTQDGSPDAMGDPTELVTTRTFKGYAWQTSSSDETANTDVQDQEWRLVLDKRAADKLRGTSSLTVSGVTGLDGELVRFEVDGPPWPALNPRTNRLEFVEARLRKAE